MMHISSCRDQRANCLQVAFAGSVTKQTVQRLLVEFVHEDVKAHTSLLRQLAFQQSHRRVERLSINCLLLHLWSQVLVLLNGTAKRIYRYELQRW